MNFHVIQVSINHVSKAHSTFANLLYNIAEKDLLFTKIVEVSPRFIVVNLTSRTIWFSQSYIPITEKTHALALEPKDRQPYHWSSKEEDRMTHFSVEEAKRPTA